MRTRSQGSVVEHNGVLARPQYSSRNRIRRLVINGRLQLALVLCATTAVTATVSHVGVAWLKIETTTGKSWEIGPPEAKPPGFMAGSSLAADGINWGQVSTQIDQRIMGWGVGGSSPWEWEPFQRKAPEVTLTFLVV